jgi:hypothetical protein
MPVNAFFRRGKSKIYFLPAVANLAAPTATEVTAGQDLSDAVTDIGGFQFSNAPIDTPDLASEFTSQIPGPDTAGDSSLTFKDDFDDDATRTLLAKGTDGFIVLMPYGHVTGKRAEVWPVTSTGFNDQWSIDNNPATSMVTFAVSSPPNQNAVLA